jgi:hypothetical protein
MKVLITISIVVGIAVGVVTILTKLVRLKTSVKDQATTKAEKRLLSEAKVHGGRIYVFQSDQTGKFVKVGGTPLGDDEEPGSQEAYLEALERLVKRGLVRMESETLYCLTGSGYKKVND